MNTGLLFVNRFAETD